MWKTTFWMDDLPARREPIRSMRGFDGAASAVDAEADWSAAMMRV